MAKKEIDIDEEIEKLARKSNINIKKTEYSFEKRIKRLDKEMDKIMNDKFKEFDKNKELVSDYLTTDYKSDSVDSYRKRLKKM
ncbi:hypothetical protein [Methanobrevibacter sp.]|uniref:hypothetical protein n=1 Tax=Methanobrevibacter sp. TaxID=66852 RepID=UPI00388F67BF